jgi:polyhydroxyalkanoic acid synthase PhaR subunit
VRENVSQQWAVDPFAVWKDLYDTNEKIFSEMADSLLRDETFSAWMGQVQRVSLFYLDLYRKSTKLFLEQANVVTRDDLAGVAQMIVNVDQKVDELDQKINEEIVDELQKFEQKGEVAKLKQEVAKLNKKLDQVIELLQAQMKEKASLAE